MDTLHKASFDDSGWSGYQTLKVRETDGFARQQEPIDQPFSVPMSNGFRMEAELRIVRADAEGLEEIPSQVYEINQQTEQLTGRVVFLADAVPAHGEVEFRLYYGNSQIEPRDYLSPLQVTKGDAGPQHYILENEFYKIETMPQSGQIWHMWNRKGANKSWHHHEWDVNKDKGGDCCHWAPNCWAAYPERITNGYDVLAGGEDIDLIDWNYAFGWQNPESQIIAGPVFWEMTRWGIVWPHPDHTNLDIKRDPSAFVYARVVYRFYASLPWFYQSSVLETMKDMRCFFIRNCQFVFLADIFSHTFIAPERTGILPNDEEDVAVLRLMAPIDQKPYTHQQHSTSNILPSKLSYYGFFNQENSDAFALFQLTEKNTNLNSGSPVYQNHATLFSELTGWSAYYCRSFSYTNQRYNPENATFLPKGERYEEENVCMLFKHKTLSETLSAMKETDRCLKHPLQSKWEYAT